MCKTNFSNNYTGKLLCDEFTTVRLHDGKYEIGQLREICLRDEPQGHAKVLGIVQFHLKDLPDIISFIDCGKNTQYLKTLLSRYYENVHEQTVFDVVVMKWTQRIPGKQTEMFKNFWDKLVERAANVTDMQMSFNY